MKSAFCLSLGLLIEFVVTANGFAQTETSPPAAGAKGKAAGDETRQPGDPHDRDEREPGNAAPGGFGGFGGPGGPGGFMGPEREILKKFDKNDDGWLNDKERKAARAFLKTHPARGPGGPGGPGGRGPGGRGFEPGGMMAKPVLTVLDTNHNNRLSVEEVVAGAKKFMASAAPGERATLDQTELAEVLNRILPAPPQFGGRGGFGGGPGGGPPGGGPGGGPGNGPGNGPGGRGPQGGPPGGQNPGAPPRGGARPADGPPGGPPGGFPGGPGRGMGPGGFGLGNLLAGSIMQRADASQDGELTTEEFVLATQELFKEADQDKNDQLVEAEVAAAIGLLLPAGPRGFGSREKGKPGPKVSATEVKTFGDEPLYAANVLRTLFLEFTEPDWESELAEFHNTDVEVPATLSVDGKQYPNVGISFRGMSSYGMVPAGSKRSFNVSLDLVDGKQRLLGYKTLNLLNANEDPSFLSTVLYSHIARKHIPTPQANFVKVVINGESWGVYVNVQQFNKEFIAENYKNAKGTRWKVRGSPGGGGGLEYFGESLDDYKRRYQMKSADTDKAWKEFVVLCKTLNKTPPEKLEAALTPLLDIDGALWFLALDVALINNDGYWVRASDYSIFLDARGQFHIIPHDMNEAFHEAMMGFGRGPGGPGGRGPGGGPGGAPGGGPGGGMRGGPGGRSGSGLELDPLIGLDDSTKPLRSKLLAVPSLKARYLEHVRTIAEEDLNWVALQPVIEQYRQLIGEEIKADTRKLTSFADFEAALSDQPAAAAPEGRHRASLRTFADQRRAYLLKVTPPVQAKAEATP